MSNGSVLYRIDSNEIIVDCENNVEVEDYVFINSDGKAEKAISSSINTMPCVGRVVRLLPNGQCAIKDKLMEKAYVGILPRNKLFISDTNPGELSDSPPNSPLSVIQEIGIGLNNSTIMVDIDPSNVIIRS
jgi:hypothetical protein